MTPFEQLGTLAERGIEIKMLSATKFEVGGFYKSGTVEVDLQSKTITARYNEVEKFDRDLIIALTILNKYWWQSSKVRFDGWKDPDPIWAELMVQQGLLTVTERVVREYK